MAVLRDFVTIKFMATCTVTEKETQVNCKRKNGKCELGKANGINKAYKMCKK